MESFFLSNELFFGEWSAKIDSRDRGRVAQYLSPANCRGGTKLRS